MPTRTNKLGALLALATPVVLVSIVVAQPQRGGPPPGGHGPQAGQGPGNQPSGQGGPGGQGGQGGSGGNQNPQRGPRRGPASRPSPDEIFDHVDTNHDGVLSRQEFKDFLAHLPPPPPPPRDGRPTTRPAPDQ